MVTSGSSGAGVRRKPAGGADAGLGQVPLEHYIRLVIHRKWLVIGVFLIVSLGTVMVSRSLPDVYKSDTVILVDPQKVPEAYVKSTVTGDVRNRLGTLSQQILSATRLQKIIETLNLYAEDRKKLAREDVITRMRSDISVHVVSDFGTSQDLQAFRISYSGKEPRLVAQVTNQLASLFIEENLKAREQQATGTTEFLENQLQESRKTLEAQEAKLKDFKLKHIGEMPEQQSADLQILGQLQSQLQLVGDALGRAEQQKSYIQSMLAQSAPVVDLDESEPKNIEKSQATAKPPVNADKARLAALLARYTEKHPDVQKLKKKIEDEEAQEGLAASADRAKKAAAPAGTETAAAEPVAKRTPTAPINHFNPILQSQLKSLEAEITKHKEERQRLSKSVSEYRAKLDAIPVREQEITQLVRDYEISKAHYSQLLEKQLSAETATQLEIRQKGEKFEILDPAQVPERPSSPHRTLINAAGSVGGLLAGLLLAIVKEFLGMSIMAPQDITAASGLAVLGLIPIIRTDRDHRLRKRRIIVASASAFAAALGCCAVLLYHYRSQIF